MARLHLIVEGQTEQAFAAKILILHLAEKGVYLSRPQLAAHARKRGMPHRGGLISYQPFRNDVVRRLKEDLSNDVFFTTMIDLYGLPDDFPGVAAAQSQVDPYRRVELLEKSLGEDIADPRFLPYIQLHEFEAILLAKPQVIDTYYDKFVREIEQLTKLAATVDSPERINDGETTAPSKRIAALIPDYARAKSTAGPIIAAEIGLPAIREKCPHFDSWLRRLEALGNNPQ